MHKNCKFTFNDEYYQQTFGMAMGNPLSPLLSNLYMEFFEKKFIPRLNGLQLIWFRYVDDILALLPVDFDVDNFLDILNSRVPSIKFTIEKESENCLPFLDVMIHREDFGFKYSIYRKPTNNLSYVHYFSGHSDNIKYSVFSSMYLRALRIVSPEYMDEELEKIKSIAKNLCYPMHFIEKCLKKAKKTFYGNNDLEKSPPNNILCLPYARSFENVIPLLRSFDVKVVFKFDNTIKNMLIKNSPHNNHNVIYTIPCKDCNSMYIGQTGKDVTTRINQHKYSVRTGQTSNSLFVHLQDKEHRINWSDNQIVCKSNTFLNRNIIESALIQLSWNENLNISKGLYSFDPLTLQILKGDLRSLIDKVIT